MCTTAPPGSVRSCVEWSGLAAATAEQAIAAELTHHAGRALEWKTYGRDTPADLGSRLTAAGFAAGEPAAFVVGKLAAVSPRPPATRRSRGWRSGTRPRATWPRWRR